MRWAVTLGATGSAIFFANLAIAQAVPTSIRPEQRPVLDTVARTQILSPLEVTKASVLRPQIRPTALQDPATPSAEASASNAEFQRWIRDFRPRALAQGIARCNL